MANKRVLYIIWFLDHHTTTGDDLGVTRCNAVGWLVSEDEDAYHIAPWITDDNVKSSDTEVFTILKKVVTKIKKIR